jgi:pimeloyl-ACP methyl ester carboxylesterase
MQLFRESLSYRQRQAAISHPPAAGSHQPPISTSHQQALSLGIDEFMTRKQSGVFQGPDRIDMKSVIAISNFKSVFRTIFAAAICGLLTAGPARATATDQLVNLAKPGGVALRYLLTTDPVSAPNPEIGVILFTGGEGRVGLANGIPQPGANFLVRSRALFAQDGLAVAVYDPSDELGALSDAARMSAPHREEVEQVLVDLKARTGVRKVYLVGTSRGTISAAYLATALKAQVEGVVLSSTLFASSRAGSGLSNFDFSSISQPLLFVHHTADRCRTTAPGYARALAGRYPVIWVDGVEGSEGDACGPHSAHGYLGREPATVRAISDWILSRKLVATVDTHDPPAAPPKK